MRSWFALFLLALVPGCPPASSCPEGTIEDLGECVPLDGGEGLDAGPTPDADAAPPDDGCSSVFYADDDMDGHGDPADTVSACAAPAGYVASSDDCDDGSAMRAPGLAETCDGLDNDCNDDVDDGASQTWYADTDADGHGDASAPMTAGCTMPAGHVESSDDCDDASDARFPGNPEVCDALDNDCDTPMVDETFECVRGATVPCTTSCGTSGMGSCSDTCIAPTGMECTPPAETCDGADQDCDGSIDEGTGSFGPRLEIGATSGRVVVVRTTNYFVALANRTGTGLVGRRFDLNGAPVGSETTLTTTSTNNFDAWAVGDRIALAWNDSTSFFLANVPEVLAAASPVNVGASDAFFGRVQVVASGSAAVLVYHDANLSRLMAIRRTFPTISGSSAAFLVSNSVRSTFDLTIDASGTRAYAAYVTSTDDVTIASLLMSGSTESIAAIDFGTANPQRAPAIAWGTAPGGASRLGLVYHENPASGDSVVFRSVSVAGSTLTLQDTATLFSASPPDTLEDPLSITHAGGRWFVSALRLTTAPSSTWSLVQVAERSGMGPTTSTSSIETTASANRGVSIAAGNSSTIFTLGGRSDGVGRGYFRGCP